MAFHLVIIPSIQRKTHVVQHVRDGDGHPHRHRPPRPSRSNKQQQEQNSRNLGTVFLPGPVVFQATARPIPGIGVRRAQIPGTGRMVA